MADELKRYTAKELHEALEKARNRFDWQAYEKIQQALVDKLLADRTKNLA